MVSYPDLLTSVFATCNTKPMDGLLKIVTWGEISQNQMNGLFKKGPVLQTSHHTS